MSKKPTRNGADQHRSDAERLKNRQQVNVGEEDAPVVYANHTQIAASIFDFRLQFGQILKADQDELRVKFMTTVFLSPQHMKAFLALLNQKVHDWEQQYGEIVLKS
jgi:hypothetical protein